MQALELFSLDRGLEGKVELCQSLDSRQARGSHGGLQPSVVPKRDLRAEDALQSLAGGDRAAVDVGQDVIDGLQRAGELEIGQHLADVVAPNRAHRTTSA